MAYRPICDFWWLARPTTGYYGSYPKGFLERARALLGVSIDDAVLHVCSGKVKAYPYLERAVGPNDKTVDLDPELEPDYLLDVRKMDETSFGSRLWCGALIDRPYTEEDADNYSPGKDALPEANDLLKRTLSVVAPGRRVGMLDYFLPRPPKKVGDTPIKFVASVGVIAGFGNRIRVYSVFERVARNPLAEK